MDNNTKMGTISGILSAIGQLHEVNSLWYNNKVLNLDGYKFISCRFDSCKLHINTTNFELVNCYLNPDTIITYGANVLKVVKLFNSRNEYMYENIKYFEPFLPNKNPDGTISITGL